MLEEIHAAGGEVFAITSEPQSLATEALHDWAFGFPAIGDPHHEIREVCRDRGFVDIYFNENCGHLRNRSWVSHPKGYYQPGVIALTKPGRVLYRWRCRPTRKNMSGAGARPPATYTWNAMRAALAGNGDSELDESPMLGAEDLSWPRFLLILLAHGWFVRPKAFPLGRSTDIPSVSPGKMMRRVTIFIAGWIVALAFLPAQWVAVAFFAWVLVLVPGLVEIHRQFQNVSVSEGRQG